MRVRYILSSVCLSLTQLSQLSFTKYMGVFLAYQFFLVTVRICVLYLVATIKSEPWIISSGSGLGQETMVCVVSCYTVYPKKYAHGFCFAVLCCGYTLTDFPMSIRLTSLALWQSNDCPSASKATLMNMDKYFMWIHYERLHNHNKAKHNKTVCIFLGIYCTYSSRLHTTGTGVTIRMSQCQPAIRHDAQV